MSCIGLTTIFSQLLFISSVPLLLIAAVAAGCWMRGRIVDALPFALWLSFLVLFTVVSFALNVFGCEDFDDGSASLRIDYATQCRDADGHLSAEYLRSATLATVVLAVYGLGVPVAYAVLLTSARMRVRGEGEEGTRLDKRLAFLTADYKPQFFYWELIQLLKKLLLIPVGRSPIKRWSTRSPTKRRSMACTQPGTSPCPGE
jgi:hypothetical protein